MMLIIRKAPALGVMWREGTSTGTRKGVCENYTLQKATRQGGDLTHDRAWGILNFPNQSSRNRRLALAPQGAEVLSAHTAIFHAPAGTVSGGRCVYIGGVATSSIREDWRLRLSRGALLPRLFFFNPKSIEVPHA